MMQDCTERNVIIVKLYVAQCQCEDETQMAVGIPDKAS